MICGYKDHIRNSYDHAVSNYFYKFYKNADITRIEDTIHKVTPDEVHLSNGTILPYGLMIWSTGTSANPLTNTIASKFDVQDNALSLITDNNCQVLGSDNIFAIGDCATIDQNGLFSKWEKIFRSADVDDSGTIDLAEFKTLLEKKSFKYPALLQVGLEADQYFETADLDKDGNLEFEEFRNLMKHIDKSITRFPTTATVATQEGTYLGNIFNQFFVPDEDRDEDIPIPPFRYKHIGGYEYVGAEDGLKERGSKGRGIYTGPGARWLWHAVYFCDAVPLKMKIAYLWDRAFTTLYGKGTTKY